jgi:hypothetical protein
MKVPIKIVVGETLELLDMFADEGISIKSVVKDMNDPKKLFTDFSRSFTVPASKQNNKVFKHYYNIDIQNSVDSRELIPAKILMNNSTYKVGNIRVEGARIENGIAVHYKITFIGKLSELSRQIGKDKIRELDFTSLDDDNFNHVSEMKNTTKRDLMFPVASRRRRFLADSATPSLGIENATNIAYSTSFVGNNTDYGISEEDIVGALSVGAILDKIETKYNFSFTGVLQADYTRDLYLWLHQTDKQRSGELLNAIATGFAYSGTANDNFTALSNGFVYSATDTTNTLGADRRFQVRVKGTFSINSTIKLRMGSQIVREVEVSGDYTDAVVIYGHYTDRIFQVEVESDSSTSVNLEVEVKQFDREYTTFGNNTFGLWVYKTQHIMTALAVVGTARTYSAQSNMPDISVMEFLSSLFKMFNIIAEVDEDLNISTKHYDHFMSEGEVKDFTKYVDVSGYDVNRPNLYSSLLMQFEEPVLALEAGYKAVNGRNYGSLRYDLTGKEGVKLSGSTYELKIKNQRAPLEPIDDLDTNSDFRVCYALFSDVGGTEQSIKPMFTYICKPDSTTGSISSIALIRNNFATDSGTTYTMPSNVHQRGQNSPVGIYGDVGLYFGGELSEYRYGFTMNNNGLWNSFYRGTTALMFDEDKRKVKLKAHIPQAQLLLLKLSDTLRLSNKFYNINSIETNYLSGVTKLDLTLVGNSQLEQFNTDSRNLENESTTDSVYITYLDATTGEITASIIAPSTTIAVSMVGSLIGSSGDIVETFA